MRRVPTAAVLLLAIPFLACAGPGPAAAPSALSRIVATGELRVGLSGDQPPFNMTTREGEIIGLDVALARVLATSLGVEARFVRRPFAGLLDALVAGEVDVVMSGMTITPERNLRASFVGPYYVSGKSLCARRETVARLEGVADLDDPRFRLAALAGSTGERFARRQLPRATLLARPSVDEAVRLLLEGGADALLADRETCVVARLRFPEADLRLLSDSLTVEPIGIALPPGDARFANLLENYLDALESQGALEKARRIWFEDPSWLRAL